MDAVLVKRFGEPIPDFVQKNGWDRFRDAESSLAEELAGRDNLVIDCGGGVVVRGSNIAVLRRSGRLVWLKASVATIAKRIHGDTQRPSLTGKKSFIEEIEEVLTVRLPLYEKASHFSVETDSLTIDEVVREVLTWWNKIGN
jgi:shikimate kinase